MQTTVVKGLKVLEYLVRVARPVPLGDVAEHCDISKSNAHRLLHTLVACGYAHHDPATRNYSVTLRMWDMGTRVYDQLDLRRIAAPHLHRLAEQTEETAHLAVFDDLSTLYLDAVDGIHAVRTYVNAGDRSPAFATASGKAMLAYQDDATIAAVGQTLRRFTDLTVTDTAQLSEHLARIRDTGFSITHGEWRPGVTAVSRAVRDRDGTVLAAVGVAGPVNRAGRTDLQTLQDAVKTAATRIEEALNPPS